MKQLRFGFRVGLCLFALVFGVRGALAQSAADFYAGKTITMYVGLTPGGGYDQNARLVARHLGKYIPGNPTVIVRNMPGGGGLIMTNYVANAAPKDGLHIAAPQRGVPFEPLLGDASHAKFDPVKLNWIGSTNADTSVAIMSARTGIKTWRDLRNRETIIGGTGVGTESVSVPQIMRNILGMKFKVIAGYPGSNELNLALERGEIEGRGVVTWTSLKPSYKEMIESGDNRILFQMGLRPHPDLPNVPLITEMADTAEQKQLLEIQFSAFELGRPQFVATEVPAARVAILRKAFNAAMKDKELLAEAEKQGLEINPVRGEEMATVLKRVYATPPALIKKLAEASAAPADIKIINTPEAKATP